jgi:hypothetical protein
MAWQQVWQQPNRKQSLAYMGDLRALHSLNEAVTGGTAKAQARTSEPFGYGISTYGR